MKLLQKIGIISLLTVANIVPNYAQEENYATPIEGEIQTNTDFITVIRNISKANSLKKILPILEQDSAVFYNLPILSPLRTRKRDSEISSDFGTRLHPVYHNWQSHNGIDFPSEKGKTVYAAGGGFVSEVGSDGRTGIYIKIDHLNGFVSVYGHLLENSVRVLKGDFVAMGEPLAQVGLTGATTGYHLHFGLRKNGIWVDPSDYCFMLEEYLNER